MILSGSWGSYNESLKVVKKMFHVKLVQEDYPSLTSC